MLITELVLTPGSNLINPANKDCPAGYHVVTPQPDELQIDIDSDETYAAYVELLSMLQAFGREVVLITDVPSKSGLPRRHVTLRYPRNLSELERVAMQACLGSDPKREMFGLLRIETGIEPVTAFFDKNPEQPA